MPPALSAPPSVPDAAPAADPVEERAEAVVRRVLQADDVPAFSRVMQDLMATLGRDEASAQRLANLVLRDYALTVKVIRAANSAHYNRTGRPVQSATHALMLLGASTVREMAGAVLLFEHYRRRSPGLKELMLLSLLTASHARAAAEAVGGAEPETAHLCGMFRNLGEVLVAAHLPDEYAAVLRRLADLQAAPARSPAARPDTAAQRTTCARAVLGCSFEEVGMAVARHWGMPDVVRLGMVATGRSGEDRAGCLTAFAHALTGAVYREDAGHAPRAADVVVDAHGTPLGITRTLCRQVADQAVADTRELFAAAGVRLDGLRLTKQVSAALADARAGAAPAPPTLAAAPTPTAVRDRLVPELEAAATDVAGYDLSRVLLMALEAVLRGGPFDRACFHAADAAAGMFRPRTGLGEGIDALLGGPGVPFAAGSGPVLLRGTEVYLAPGAGLALTEARLLRDWDAAGVVLVPVTVGGVVIGCVHADRRAAGAPPDAATMAYVRAAVRALEQGLAARRGGGAPSTFDAAAKVAAVLRVLRGESAPEVARALGVDAGVLEQWRVDFLAGAAARLGDR